MILVLMKWSYKSFPIILAIELRIISLVWACSTIYFKHMIYFWGQFLDPHLTSYNSNVDVQIIVVLEWGTSTLRLIDICHSCLAKLLPQNLMYVCVCCMYIIETVKSCEERTPSELYLLEETVTNVNLIHNLPLSKRLEASSYVSTTQIIFWNLLWWSDVLLSINDFNRCRSSWNFNSVSNWKKFS